MTSIEKIIVIVIFGLQNTKKAKAITANEKIMVAIWRAGRGPQLCPVLNSGPARP